MPNALDAVVVGAGPNGLAAAITLAEAGLRVRVLEANAEPGGAVRSGPLTEPGFVHDFGAAILPMAVGTAAFRRLPLERYGLAWVHPEVPLAHPLDGGRAALMHRSLDETAAGFGADGPAYRALVGPFVEAWPEVAADVFRPMLHVPRHPVVLARFGLRAILPARRLAALTFRGEPAAALFAGVAGHAASPLEGLGSSAFALVLCALAHRVGWPFPRGGAGALTDALVAHLRALGGEVVTDARIGRLDELPEARTVLLDVAPEALLRMADARLPLGYRRRLARYRRAPGVFKLDYALDGPIPWASPDVARSATVHLGGTLDEISACEQAAYEGRVPEHPYVILAQPSLFDPTRAPAGRHTAWAYCHVPNGSEVDMTARIEAQIERFAPGFGARVRARRVWAPADLERADANLVGGDIVGGAQDVWTLAARPVLRPDPYRTPLPGVYLCSASTPPGGGVHGLCGMHAARTALRDLFSR